MKSKVLWIPVNKSLLIHLVDLFAIESFEHEVAFPFKVVTSVDYSCATSWAPSELLTCWWLPVHTSFCVGVFVCVCVSVSQMAMRHFVYIFASRLCKRRDFYVKDKRSRHRDEWMGMGRKGATLKRLLPFALLLLYYYLNFIIERFSLSVVHLTAKQQV